MDLADELDDPTSPSSKKKQSSQRRASTNKKARKPANLACLNCRPRKIKCHRVDGVCERCRTFNLPCNVPDRDERKLRYSKEYIEGLESEIAELRHVLAQVHHNEHSVSPTQQSDSQSTVVTGTDGFTSSSRKGSSPPDSLIERLCGMKPRQHSNGDGQNRYFGPTSSLHFTETPDTISHYGSVSASDVDIEQGISEALQQYLLDLYWSYQHSILPCVHKEAFLAGMEVGRGPYFSRSLLLCILASGARISAQREIRALSIPTDDVDKDEKRPLMKQAEDALEKEITNPSLTTIQSLLLMSVLYCIQSNDSKAWMLSGNACRLVFDLGLHQDWAYLSVSKLSPIDVDVRQLVFWGCFNLDRLWALYLGRPPFIKLTDVSIRRPDRDARSWDLRIFAACVELLDIAGQIADKLNTNSCSQLQIDHYSDALQRWHDSLEPSLLFESQANSAVYHLHLQYSAMVILANRHNAGFGNLDRRNTPEAMRSRQTCLYHAFRIANILQEYRALHGDAGTMLGSALYNTTMAATTLVAEISETRKEGMCDELICLMHCLRTMKEMENTEIVAKNVYNIVQTIMRVCNVQDEALDLESLPPAPKSPIQPLELPPQLPYDPSVTGLNQTTLAMWPAFDFEGMDMGDAFPFAFEQPLLCAEAGALPPIEHFM